MLEKLCYGQKADLRCGGNNGDDAAFYLEKGFRLVSIDADPSLCEQIRDRFADQIERGDLVVENVGVSASFGSLPFYLNDHSDWSSFVKGSKATQSGSFREVSVETAPFASILDRNGAAYYVKLDIEGFETQAIRSMIGSDHRPDFVSTEINAKWEICLDLLADGGYRSFQIVRQGPDHLPHAPVPAKEGNTVDVKYNNRMSGPFGYDLPEGRWLNREEIGQAVLDVFAQRKANLANQLPTGWDDIHCSLERLY